MVMGAATKRMETSIFLTVALFDLGQRFGVRLDLLTVLFAAQLQIVDVPGDGFELVRDSPLQEAPKGPNDHARLDDGRSLTGHRLPSK